MNYKFNRDRGEIVNEHGCQCPFLIHEIHAHTDTHQTSDGKDKMGGFVNVQFAGEKSFEHITHSRGLRGYNTFSMHRICLGTCVSTASKGIKLKDALRLL